MELSLSDADWEAMHAHYDQRTYRAVLDQLTPNDIILDIGAGDLRLARQMAPLASKVYAIEINAEVLERSDIARDPLPSNLTPVCADARLQNFPSDVTTGVLMMRHCTCFGLYVDKLREVGAVRLITNVRWRMGVEVVNLVCPRSSYADIRIGWYACLCGGTGFKEGPAEGWTIEMDRIVHEVSSCPWCM